MPHSSEVHEVVQLDWKRHQRRSCGIRCKLSFAQRAISIACALQDSRPCCCSWKRQCCLESSPGRRRQNRRQSAGAAQPAPLGSQKWQLTRPHGRRLQKCTCGLGSSTWRMWLAAPTSPGGTQLSGNASPLLQDRAFAKVQENIAHLKTKPGLRTILLQSVLQDPGLCLSRLTDVWSVSR